MESINFIVVCTEKYTAEYANKSLNMFKRNYFGDFTPFCITDKAKAINPDYFCIESSSFLSGWWNKLSIFNQELPHENTLYVDLDLLILNDITSVVRFAADNLANYEIACFGDHIRWHGEKFGSAFMFFNQKKMRWIYLDFISALQEAQQTKGGDQIWIGKRLSRVLYLDEHFNNFVRSLKFDISKVATDKRSIKIPANLEKDFMLLNCHGEPKPHQLLELGWEPIKSIWV